MSDRGLTDYEVELLNKLASEKSAREKAETSAKFCKSLADDSNEKRSAMYLNLQAAEQRIRDMERKLAEQQALLMEVVTSGEECEFDDVTQYVMPIETYQAVSDFALDQTTSCVELNKLLSERSVPEFAIELPDGDTRNVKVWFVEKRDDGKTHISISVDSERSVPESLLNALRNWSGNEPSQSVLAREVDAWLSLHQNK